MFYSSILLEILCGAGAAIFLEIYELRCSELHGWIIFNIFGVKMKMIQTGSVQRQGGWGWSEYNMTLHSIRLEPEENISIRKMLL